MNCVFLNLVFKLIKIKLYLLIGLTEQTCDLVDFRHVTSMADYALQLFSQIEEVNTHSFNNFRLRVGKKYLATSRI